MFDAFKHFKVNKRYEETKEELNKQIPIREELERKKENLIKVGNTKAKYNLFRSAAIKYTDVLFRSF